MSVSLSFRSEKFNTHWEDFHEIFRENSSSIKIGQEKPVLHIKTNTHFWSFLTQFFLELKNISENFVKKIESRFMLKKKYFRKSCRFWDNVEGKKYLQQDKTQMTILRMRVTCWYTKGHAQTNRISNIYCFSTATKVAWTNPQYYVYTYIDSLVLI